MGRSAVSLLILLGLISADLCGQNTAELRGTVVDQTGAVLPGVSMTLTQKNSNQERRQFTDSSGSYVFASLVNGDYSLRAEFSGFKSQVRDGITLQVGQRSQVDLSLEVGAIDEKVTVTEDLSLMRTTNAEISDGCLRSRASLCR